MYCFLLWHETNYLVWWFESHIFPFFCSNIIFCVFIHFLYIFNYPTPVASAVLSRKPFPSFLKCSDTLYTISFAFEVKSFEEALSVMSYVQIYKTDWTLSLPIQVNGLLLIHEIKEMARETQCFTLPCHSTQGRHDFTNIIIEKEICWGSTQRISDRKQCSLTRVTPRPSHHCRKTKSYWIL